MSKEKKSKIRNYALQRNYYYDSHDKDGNYNGLTETEWKENIRKEWNCEKLKAKLVVLIFHTNNLHVHAILNLDTSMSRSNVFYLSKCSKIEDCIPLLSKKQIANAYKYLLHIDEKSLKLKKYIYGQNELEIYSKDNKKFDYHKMIACADEEELTEQDDKKLLQKVLVDIQNGCYGDIYTDEKDFFLEDGKGNIKIVGQLSIYNQILLDEKIRHLLLSKSNEKKILYAINQRKVLKNLLQEIQN